MEIYSSILLRLLRGLALNFKEGGRPSGDSPQESNENDQGSRKLDAGNTNVTLSVWMKLLEEDTDRYVKQGPLWWKG